MLESLDAGAAWRRNSSSFHVDQHALALDPRVANRVFIGNDGGVYRSTANGSLTGSWTKSTSQTNMQFYTVAVSRQDISRISGGLQDNGSLRTWCGTDWNSDRRRRRPGQPDRPDQPEQGVRLLAVRRRAAAPPTAATR